MMAEEIVTLSDLGDFPDEDQDVEADVQAMFADVDAYLLRSTAALDESDESEEEEELPLAPEESGLVDPVLRAAMERCATDMRELCQLADDTAAMLPASTPREPPEVKRGAMSCRCELRELRVQVDEQVREKRAAQRAAEEAERAELAVARERLQSARRARIEAAEHQWKEEAARREDQIAEVAAEAEAEAEELERAVEREAAEVKVEREKLQEEAARLQRVCVVHPLCSDRWWAGARGCCSGCGGASEASRGGNGSS